MKKLALLVLLLGCLSCFQKPGATITSKPDNIAREFELKKICYEVGRRYWETEFRDNYPSGYVLVNPRYAYNKEINTCIVLTGMMSKGFSGYHITDTLTNVELASSEVIDGNNTGGWTPQQFEVIKKRLFPAEAVVP
jgi:hypothetical protein